MLKDLREEFRSFISDNYLEEGDDVSPRFSEEWTGSNPSRPEAVVRPANPPDISKVMELCNRFSQRVVILGGLTGMARGAVAAPKELGISLDRLTEIEEVDPVGRTMTVQSGVTLQRIQEEAQKHGLSFPLDLGGRGSCTIGGMISTNAGGNRVLRYGMTRDMILGLEAVLADGRVVSSMNHMLKNNTGYDLKQLFIGSEGTLGIVTRAVLRLRPATPSQNVGLIGCKDFSTLMKAFHYFDQQISGQLSAFEVMWNDFYSHITQSISVRPPIPKDYPIYALVESLGNDHEQDRHHFSEVVQSAFKADLVEDAAIAHTGKQAQELWSIRDGIGEVLSRLDHFAPFDISMKLTVIEPFVERIRLVFDQHWPDATKLFFGHIGDNNLHIVLEVSGLDEVERAEGLVYDVLKEYGGSISAEHGVGTLKRPYLKVSRSPTEIELMRQLKHTLDPKGLLNKNRIFWFDQHP